MARRTARSANKKRHWRRWQGESLEPRLMLATFTVTQPGDAGPGSVRDAIAQSNSLSGADVVDFAPNLAFQTIQLTSGVIEITDSLTIDGSDLALKARLNASGSGFFDVHGPPEMAVAMQALQLQSADATAIFSSSSLSLLDVRIEDTYVTSAPCKGAALTFYGNDIHLSLRDSIITGNSCNQLTNRKAVK